MANQPATKSSLPWQSTEAEVFKFEKKGDFIEGVLVSKVAREVDGEGKQVQGAKYTLRNLGQLFFFWGSAILDDRMKVVESGDAVNVTFTGNAKTHKKGQSPAKLFKVDYVKKKDLELLGEDFDLPF